MNTNGNSKNKTDPEEQRIKLPDRNTLRDEYDKDLPAMSLIARKLEKRISEIIIPVSSRPRVRGRVKSFESYFKKHIRILKNKVSGDSPRITDLIGIRIICLFLEDLAAIETLLENEFQVIEAEKKGRSHTFREFGYESIHLLIVIPEGLVNDKPRCETAEIQIRTILQDAWAEVEHELVYKAEFNPFDTPLKRKLAAVNASLSLADIIFQEIRYYQRELNGELGKRRDSFFRKIEDSTDAVLFSGEKASVNSIKKKTAPSDEMLPSIGSVASSGSDEGIPPLSPAGASMDDLLLEALSAHNKKRFDEAIAIYTRILQTEPVAAISSLIYKHRGMAFFARSHYEEAIADFSESSRLDPKSYKASYYEGIVCSVLMRYSHALDAYNRSLEINPYQPYCLYRRGQAYYHLEDYPQALGDCEAALAIKSFDAAIKFRELIQEKLKM